MNSAKMMAQLGLVAMLCLLGGCANHIVPIANIHGQALPAQAQGLSPDEMTRRISAAATALGWQVAAEGPTQLRANYTKQDHIVTVRITYSQSAYNIDFVSSINMDQENGRIHHKYADWLAALNARIAAELSQTA